MEGHPSFEGIMTPLEESSCGTETNGEQVLKFSKKFKGNFHHVSAKELQSSASCYEYAIIVRRRVKVEPNVLEEVLSSEDEEEEQGSCGKNFFQTLFKKRRRSSSSYFTSPLLSDGAEEQSRIVDSVCRQGLNIDIIDGGHSGGELTSDFLILLISIEEKVVEAYSSFFRRDLWLRHGNIRDLQMETQTQGSSTSAERVEIIDFLIRQGSRLSERDPWVEAMLPIHDTKVIEHILSEWISPHKFRQLELEGDKFVLMMKNHFGEKVAYYFAFAKFYNRALAPLALVGICVYLSQRIWGTKIYMQVLPFWGLLVSVGWSFSLLKLWDRRNAELNYQWGDKLHAKQVRHPRTEFRGSLRVDPVTGKFKKFYPAWKRIPKYVCVGLFMAVQIVIMLVLVSVWVSLYEAIKVEFPHGGLLTVQWWLILLEGIVFGLFVDVFQWSVVVMKVARWFTSWENYSTEEAYEKALIRKLFLMDFLNYYTWFFLLAFVYILPHLGNLLTNYLNHAVYGDPLNCCFGPFVASNASEPHCLSCPSHQSLGECIPCRGIFTFDRKHVDLEAMFVNPVVVTQSLNMILGVLMPVLMKRRQNQVRAAADSQAKEVARLKGERLVIGSLDYHEGKRSFENRAKSRYITNSSQEIEILDSKARECLFEASQPSYDPYDDFHGLVVQFGFCAMFSLLWPLMPLACLIINLVKIRTDAYRLCATLKRPLPRQANGIGDWRTVLYLIAFIAILINVSLVCISTGSLEFYVEECVEEIEKELRDRGQSLSEFIMGPNFKCISVTTRVVVLVVAEHIVLVLVVAFVRQVPKVPRWVRVAADKKEYEFKRFLQNRLGLLAAPAALVTASDHSQGMNEGLLMVSSEASTPSEPSLEHRDRGLNSAHYHGTGTTMIEPSTAPDSAMLRAGRGRSKSIGATNPSPKAYRGAVAPSPLPLHLTGTSRSLVSGRTVLPSASTSSTSAFTSGPSTSSPSSPSMLGPGDLPASGFRGPDPPRDPLEEYMKASRLPLSPRRSSSPRQGPGTGPSRRSTLSVLPSTTTLLQSLGLAERGRSDHQRTHGNVDGGRHQIGTASELARAWNTEEEEM